MCSLVSMVLYRLYKGLERNRLSMKQNISFINKDRVQSLFREFYNDSELEVYMHVI